MFRDANPMICPYLRTGSFSPIAATAILWPRGTRSRAVLPATAAPGAIWSTATMTLSPAARRMVRGVAMVWLPVMTGASDSTDGGRDRPPWHQIAACRPIVRWPFQGTGVFFTAKPATTAVFIREDRMRVSRPSRRHVLKTAALGSAAVIAAPYVHGAYAAGSLSLGCWDHWVPGANKALDKLCKEWGDKNKADAHTDYTTSQGEKAKLTAAAEAQAGTGHDIMSHRDWNIQVHQRVLEPLDDVVNQLIKQYGPISPVAEYLAKIKGTWRGVPTAVGSQVKPCQSRF